MRVHFADFHVKVVVQAEVRGGEHREGSWLVAEGPEFRHAALHFYNAKVLSRFFA